MARKTLQRIVNRSKDRAFAQLFDAHADALYRFIYWRIGDEDAAKDMLSEVFSKAWQRWDAFEGAYPKAWLYTIARNMVIDSYRRKEDTPLDSVDDIADDASLEEATDKQLAADELHTKLGLLPAKSREVLSLRFIAGLSAKDAATILETSEENIRVMQYRALRELRKLYER